jgi:3-oxoacyl-[acyl-carrier protein] reductase
MTNTNDYTPWALVTGASKGIGRAIAVALAADGMDIAVHYHSDEPGAAITVGLVENVGRTAWPVCFDVTDRSGCVSELKRLLDTRGAPFSVIVNAGVTADNAFPAMDGADWDLVLRTDLDGFYNVVHPLTMPMVQARRGGRIVTISSAAGIMGNRGQVNYSAAKAGLIGATKSLAVELAKRDITVNCVAPGLIETQMTANVPSDVVKTSIPMRRMGSVTDIAHCVAFLCSGKAGYITRQVIAVNGGMH